MDAAAAGLEASRTKAEREHVTDAGKMVEKLKEHGKQEMIHVLEAVDPACLAKALEQSLSASKKKKGTVVSLGALMTLIVRRCFRMQA